MLSHRLRHRIAFERQVIVQDPDTGAQRTDWVPATTTAGDQLDSVPAEVLTGPGREFEGAATKNAETAARINLRWFPGLQYGWRVLWDGRRFDIQSIETDATGRQEYRLRCVDGPSEGV